MRIYSAQNVIQHLQLGTARIVFYDMDRKTKSSTINLTRPFYLRVETYRGVDRHGQPKFKNNNEAGKLLFNWILDNGVYNHAHWSRLLNYHESKLTDMLEQAGYGEEFAFMLKEFRQWDKSGGCQWVDHALKSYANADNEDDDKKKKAIVENYEERTKGDHFLNGFGLGSCRLHKAHRIRGGFKYRFERTFFRPTDMNIYLLDYLELLCNSLDSLEITSSQLTQAIAENMGYIGYYSLKVPKERSNLLSEINRDYSAISRLSEKLESLSDDQIVQMYEFNQSIPAFVFKDRMTSSLTRRLFEENLVEDSCSFSYVFKDDVSLATCLMSRKHSRIYRYLSPKLKRMPEIYQYVDDIDFGYLPKSVRSNREFMLSRPFQWMHNIVHAAPILLNDIDYLTEAFARANGDDIDAVARLQTDKNLTKEFLEELKLVGATVRIKGDLIPIYENPIRELMPESGRYIDTCIAFNAEHVDAVQKMRFAKTLEAKLNIKEDLTPTKRNKI